MKKNDLRVSTNIDELTQIIENIVFKKLSFMIWQNRNEARSIIHGRLYGHLITETSLTLDFKISENSNVNTKKRIFLVNEELKILMKAKVKMLGQSRLKLSIDKRFFLEEKRFKQRIDLETREFEADIHRKIELKDRHKLETVQLKNISDTGCGFYINSSRAVLFQPDSFIALGSIGGVEFPAPLKGRIKHVTPVNTGEKISGLNTRMFLVGVEFEDQYKDIDEKVQEAQIRKTMEA